jgi:hypothetical protein
VNEYGQTIGGMVEPVGEVESETGESKKVESKKDK